MAINRISFTSGRTTSGSLHGSSYNAKVAMPSPTRSRRGLSLKSKSIGYPVVPTVSKADIAKAKIRAKFENLTYEMWENVRMLGQTRVAYTIMEDPKASVQFASLAFNSTINKPEISLMVSAKDLIGGSTYLGGIYVNTIFKKKGNMFIPTRNGVLVALHKLLICMPFEGNYEAVVGKYTVDFTKFGVAGLKVAIRYLKQVDTKNGRAWLAPLIDLLITQEELNKQKYKKKRNEPKIREFESPYDGGSDFEFRERDEDDDDEEEDDELLPPDEPTPARAVLDLGDITEVRKSGLPPDLEAKLQAARIRLNQRSGLKSWE